MYYPIELDKARNFKYGMKAISLIEKKLKKPISQIDFENLFMEEMAAIIWAGLVHEDKNLSVDRVMNLVDDSTMSVTEIFDVAADALNKAFNGEDTVENDGKNV